MSDVDILRRIAERGLRDAQARHIGAVDIWQHMLDEIARFQPDRLAAELSAARAALAWELYCSETAGDMDVRDCWEQLPASAQTRYLRMAASRATPSAEGASRE